MIVPRILSLHIGQLKEALPLLNHRTIVIPFIGHRLGTLRNHFKGNGLIKVRTDITRLCHNHRRLGQVNSDRSISKHCIFAFYRQFVFTQSLLIHIVHDVSGGGCPVDHCPILGPLVSQRLIARHRDVELQALPLDHSH